MNAKNIGLLLGPLSFIFVFYFFDFNELSSEGRAILASTFWIAIWWITEAIPIAATSLLPIILFPLLNGLSLNETTSSYGHRFVFLYLGGFILALSIEKWNLHKRIALSIIKVIGTDVKKIILGFMIATAFLSMWISNTATSVMMLPIGIAIVKQMNVLKNKSQNEDLDFGKSLMLSIAYSASIGGVATLIGTPPNLVFAGIIQELYNIEISFLNWLIFGLPISILLLLIAWVYLTQFAFKFSEKKFEEGGNEIDRQLKNLGPISYEEKIVLLIFFLTGFAWITRTFLLNSYLPNLDDSIIAIISGISLFILKTKNKNGKVESIMDWDDAVKLPWGILLLFGGGLAIAQGFQSSGLADWIAGNMTKLQGLSFFLILISVITSVNFLTEITSNLATTAMLLPILAPMAITLGIHPYILMVGATVASSCAFMLPVATPPNAVVFGSNYLRISDMVKVGVIMNLISIIVIQLMVYFMLPIFWGFDMTKNPFN